MKGQSKKDYLAMFQRLLLLWAVLFWFLPGHLEAVEHQGQISFAAASWPPVIYWDEQKNVRGFYVDILQEVFEKRLGLDISYNYYPWKRAQHEVRSANMDCLIGIPTPERLRYAVPSNEPFFLLYLNVYTYEGHPLLDQIEQINSVEDIKRLGLTTVSNIGNAWQEENIESAGIVTHYTPTEQNAVRFLARKRADIMIDAVIPTNHVIKKMGLASKLVLTKAKFGPIRLHLLIGKQSPHRHRLEDINEAFAEMREEGLFERYLLKYSSLD